MNMNMNQFIKYKLDISSELRQNQNFLDLLFDELNISPDEDEIKKRLHTENFIPDPQVDAKTHICLDSIVTKAINFNICSMEIVFIVITHKTLIENNDNLNILGNKVDNLCIAIDTMMNGKRLGIGKFRLKPVNPMSYINHDNYIGKSITYVCEDFNTNTTVNK
jgi:hypothetical protein